MANGIKEMANVRKSCTIARTVVRVITILLLVGMILCFVGAGACFALSGRIDKELSARPDAVENISMSIRFMDMDFTDAAREKLNQGHYGLFFGIMALVGGVMVGFILSVYRMIGKIFDTILANDSPFTAGVLKRLKVCFILISVLLLFSQGLFPGVCAGLFFWCIYTILEYGAALQQQADETL